MEHTKILKILLTWLNCDEFLVAMENETKDTVFGSNTVRPSSSVVQHQCFFPFSWTVIIQFSAAILSSKCCSFFENFSACQSRARLKK